MPEGATVRNSLGCKITYEGSMGIKEDVAIVKLQISDNNKTFLNLKLF